MGTPKADGMGRANETLARTGCPFPSIDRGVSDPLMPWISTNREKTTMPLVGKTNRSISERKKPPWTRVVQRDSRPYLLKSGLSGKRRPPLASEEPRELTGPSLGTRPWVPMVRPWLRRLSCLDPSRFPSRHIHSCDI
ncbi:hypothetical protein CRG98_008699 [Punica granatum]|uniref:Uncharacterized protein n=1 Tax=Punica granatum TaxID=22663 RepID=A0A2I0KQX3_PUNGR|nr:hypothetical protein CRG98_008699 [Punica granatum]